MAANRRQDLTKGRIYKSLPIISQFGHASPRGEPDNPG